MRRASLGLLLAAALLLWAPSAWARSSTRDGDLEGSASGQITVTWHGDPARGCAAAGVCDVSGSIVFSPELIDIYGTFRPDGRFYPGEAVIFSGEPAVVRTRRANASGPPSMCLDLVDAEGAALSPTEQPGGRYSFDVSTAHSFTDGLSTGRCTGPTAKQLATVFPSGLLQAASKGHRSRVFDLSGRSAFTAGPFSGEIISTAAARLWPLFEEDDSESDSGSDDSRPHRRTIRLLTVGFEYRVKSMAGSLVTSFNGSGEPFCVPFDSCGVSGTSTYATTVSRGVVAVGGWRTLRRGETKPTRREAMRELRSGRLAVSGDSMLPEGALARVVSSVRYPDGSSCVDPGETTALAALTLAHSRSAAHFVLGPADFERGTVVRTDCQGPSEEDVLGSKAPLATASLPVTALGSKSLHVDLTAGGAFRTGAYTGSRSGAISLQLVLKATRVGVTRLKISGGLFEE